MVMFPAKAKSEKYQVLFLLFMAFSKRHRHLTDLQYQSMKGRFIENEFGSDPKQSQQLLAGWRSGEMMDDHHGAWSHSHHHHPSPQPPPQHHHLILSPRIYINAFL